MTKTLKNQEIYNIANNLLESFQDGSVIFPVKVNFYLMKNINTFKELGTELEKARMDIVQKYGTLNEEGTNYIIPPEKIEDASKELNELFAVEQEVKIYCVDLDAFGDVDLTAKQMDAVLFMINDPED